MKTRSTARRAIDIAITALLLIFPAAFLHSSFKNPENLNILDKAVLTISAPLQSAVGWVIDGIGGVWNRYVWLVDVEEENDELRAENERLHRELAEARRQAASARELERLVDVREKVPAETTGARVVAASMNPYFRVTRVTLDRGEGEVEPGMAVLARDGLVGRVLRVYGGYADVLLSVDPESAVDVVVPRTGTRGILKGVGGKDEYTARLEYVVRSAELEVGDVVVTSGIGGVFPRDVPVGTITSVEKAEYGLYQIVEVEPAVDFSDLSRVLVVLSPPPPADPDAGAREPERAFGVKAY